MNNSDAAIAYTHRVRGIINRWVQVTQRRHRLLAPRYRLKFATACLVAAAESLGNTREMIGDLTMIADGSEP